MKVTLTILAVGICALLAGCETLRFAPSQAQKQNAWLHHRTAVITAQTAQAEQTSQKLQALAKLGAAQSRAFVTYYGLPKQLPQAETADDVLSAGGYELAAAAAEDAAARPDPWQLADNALELAIGLAGLVGGVYGTRAVRFLTQARQKSKALKEIVQGNELFKRNNSEYAAAFKQAHAAQSPTTRRLVAEMKT